MNSPSHDISLYLASAGLGSFGGNSSWSLHDGGLPDKPDRAVGVATTTGAGPDTDEQDVFQPGIQVLTRSTKKTEAYQRQEEIRDLLILPLPVTCETSVFSLINLTSDIVDIGRDDRGRYVFSANYTTRRTNKET